MKNKIKFIDDIKSLKDKKVLLRTDYNVPINKGKIQDNSRIVKSIETIKLLWKKGAKKIIILSHLGRPDGVNEKYSLKKIHKELDKKLKQKVAFTNLFSDEFEKIIKEKRRKIILCENVRFFKGENDDNSKLSKKIASQGDVFVNDAFATCHRKHSSTYGITKYLPSYAGLLIKNELSHLNKILNPKKPLVWILGGVKKEKEDAIKKATKKADMVLVGSGIRPDMNYPTNIIFPEDNVDKKDIGWKTIILYTSILARANTIVWNGPLGMFEEKKYSKGTKEIAKFISKLNCIKIIGGGETAEAIKKLKLERKMTYISTGGGATLQYLLSEKLPCLDVLNGKI